MRSVKRFNAIMITLGVMFVLIGLLMLSSCGKKKQTVIDAPVYSVKEFNLSANTVKFSEVKPKSNNQNNGNGSSPVDTSSTVGEITFIGEDNSTSYEVQGDDIIFDYQKFVGLNKCIENITTDLNKTNIINFIVKTYRVKGVDNIYTVLNTFDYSDEYAISPDEELEQYDKYREIKAKYDGDPVTWAINLADYYGKHSAIIYGSNKYILVLGLTSDVSIDMSTYDMSFQNKETSEEIESTSEEIESTSEE